MKKPGFLSCARLWRVNIVWFLAYASEEAGRLHIPMDNVCSACLPFAWTMLRNQGGAV